MHRAWVAGAGFILYVLYWCLEVFLLSRTQDRNDQSNGGWWTINIKMNCENNTQLSWGCLQDAAMIRKEISTVIIINSEDSVNKSVCNATFLKWALEIFKELRIGKSRDLSQCLNAKPLSLNANNLYLAFILNRFLLAADGSFVRI